MWLNLLKLVLAGSKYGLTLARDSLSLDLHNAQLYGHSIHSPLFKLNF